MEATILGFIAEKNLPFTTAPDLVDLCKEVTHDPNALNEVALGETAAKYKTVHGVAKTFKARIINDLQSYAFALNIDEATSKNDKKVLCILVSYFNPQLEQVVVRHLESVSLVRVTSDVLVDLMESNSIPWTNLISVLMDSCNVMRGSKTGLETRLREKAPHLLDTDGDTCHHAHNAAKVFCKSFGGLAESLFSDLHTDFKWSADLKEILHEICILLGIKMSTPKRYVPHRWLSAYDVALDTTRLLPALVLLYYGFLPVVEAKEFQKMFDSLCQENKLSEEARQKIASFHALLRKKKMTKEGCARKVRICEKILHVNSHLQMILRMYVAVLPMLKAYTMFFEKKRPLIHKLLDEQERLVREFLACFVAPEAFKDLSMKRLCSLDVEKHVMPKNNIFLGRARQLVSTAGSKSKSQTASTFMEQARTAYVSCAEYLLKKPFLESAQALDPICKGHTAIIAPLERLGDFMTSVLTEEEKVDYCREVQVYNVDTSLLCKEEDLDKWWWRVQKTGKYPCLSKVALAVASCFHGPQVEAAFSSMGDILDEKSASMKVDTYSALQTTRYFLRSCKKNAAQYFHRDDVAKTPVNKSLCKNIQTSRKVYQDYCDAQNQATQSKEKAFSSPAQASAPSKRKYASMMDFYSKKARMEHSLSHEKC